MTGEHFRLNPETFINPEVTKHGNRSFSKRWWSTRVGLLPFTAGSTITAGYALLQMGADAQVDPTIGTGADNVMHYWSRNN